MNGAAAEEIESWGMEWILLHSQIKIKLNFIFICLLRCPFGVGPTRSLLSFHWRSLICFALFHQAPQINSLHSTSALRSLIYSSISSLHLLFSLHKSNKLKLICFVSWRAKRSKRRADLACCFACLFSLRSIGRCPPHNPPKKRKQTSQTNSPINSLSFLSIWFHSFFHSIKWRKEEMKWRAGLGLSSLLAGCRGAAAPLTHPFKKKSQPNLSLFCCRAKWNRSLIKNKINLVFSSLTHSFAWAAMPFNFISFSICFLILKEKTNGMKEIDWAAAVILFIFIKIIHNWFHQQVNSINYFYLYIIFKVLPILL